MAGSDERVRISSERPAITYRESALRFVARYSDTSSHLLLGVLLLRSYSSAAVAGCGGDTSIGPSPLPPRAGRPSSHPAGPVPRRRAAPARWRPASRTCRRPRRPRAHQGWECPLRARRCRRSRHRHRAVRPRPPRARRRSSTSSSKRTGRSTACSTASPSRADAKPITPTPGTTARRPDYTASRSRFARRSDRGAIRIPTSCRSSWPSTRYVSRQQIHAISPAVRSIPPCVAAEFVRPFERRSPAPPLYRRQIPRLVDVHAR